jgi:segregation and condensation protein B
MVDSSRPEDGPTSSEPSDLGLGQFESVADDQGISLEELSRTYAQLMSKGEDPYELPSRTAGDEAGAAAVVAQQTEQQVAQDKGCPLSPRSILEAILFVGHPGNEPISCDQVAALMRGVPPGEIDALVEELNEEYRRNGHPYQIATQGSGYRMILRDEFASLRGAFYGRVRQARLSQAAIDVLAIVAYKQGLTRERIDTLRGKPSGAILSQLVRRRLLRIDRPKLKPRTPRYYTTNRFLELFALQALEELPHSQDLDREL